MVLFIIGRWNHIENLDDFFIRISFECDDGEAYFQDSIHYDLSFECFLQFFYLNVLFSSKSLAIVKGLYFLKQFFSI